MVFNFKLFKFCTKGGSGVAKGCLDELPANSNMSYISNGCKQFISGPNGRSATICTCNSGNLCNSAMKIAPHSAAMLPIGFLLLEIVCRLWWDINRVTTMIVNFINSVMEYCLLYKIKISVEYVAIISWHSANVWYTLCKLYCTRVVL